MNEDSRQRLNAALDVIRKVYRTVDESLSTREIGIMQTAYESLLNSGSTSRQAKKILARELCAGILATDTGYAFCERVAMDNVAMMHSPMNLQA